MLYEEKIISIDDLHLDEKNPRFITPPNATQQSIIDYLIEFEEADKLAFGINQSGILFAGERIIAVKEDNKYVVLEGNRRVCACKILHNPQLLRNTRQSLVGKLIPSAQVLENTKELRVDVVPSRISAQSSLAAKHIDGVKRWSTISKYKFFAIEFDSGKTLFEIERVTGISQNKIKTGIKDYKIIEYVLNLECWKEEEKKYLNLQEIKTTRLTRLFGAKPKNEGLPKLRELLRLQYDDKYCVTTSLKKEVFDGALYIIAKAAFIPNSYEGFEGTRSSYDDIPELMTFLEQHNLFIKPGSVNMQTSNAIVPSDDLKVMTNVIREDINLVEKKENESVARPNNRLENTNSIIQEEIAIQEKVAIQEKINNKQDKRFSSSRDNLITSDFSVKCTNTKILNIIGELKRINLNLYINSAAVLLRVLIELSVKYYLNTTGNSDKINEGDLPGTVLRAIGLMRSSNLINNPEHSMLTNLGKNEKSFQVFNGFVHYDSILPTKDIVINYFDNYKKMLEICLNK